MNKLNENITAVSNAANNKPQIDMPSMASSTMVTTLNIGVWSDERNDRAATAQVTVSNNASDKAARVQKFLFGGNCAELEAIKAITSEARRVHKSLTVPWGDGGPRALANLAMPNHVKVMSHYEQEHAKAVDALVAVWNDLVIDAQVSLGDMYDPNEYPTSEEVRSRFYFRCGYEPMPQSGNFLTDIADENVRVAVESCDRMNEFRIQNMLRDVFNNVFKMLGNMSERLDYTDTGETEEYRTKPSKANPNGKVMTRKVGVKKFHDTLVSNALDAADLMALYIPNDPVVRDAKRKLDETLRNVTEDDLRGDGDLRKDVKRNVDDVLASLETFDI